MNNRGKKIYVNGGVVIKTSFFRYQDAGASYDTPPEGCEQIECKDQIEGQPCIIIKEDCAPSIFNEYYAKTFFSTLYEWAPFLHKTYNDCYTEYKNNITEISELMAINGISKQVENTLLRQVFISIIAAVDTFVCDTILTRISDDKESFYTYFRKIILDKCPKDMKTKKKEALERMWNKNEMDSAEQEVFDNVLNTSYSNIKTIKELYKLLFGISVYDTDGKMKKHFRTRHLIAHRNGRKKSGEYYNCSKDKIKDLIADANDFIHQIVDKLK